MRLRSVRATGVRNLECTLGELPDGVVALVGANGQGKTSVLEAISLALTGRSFRTHDRSAVVGRGVQEAVVSAEVVLDDGRSQRVGRRVSADGSLETRVDGQTERRSVVLPVVSFDPADLVVVSGPPQHRRDFLDRSLVELDPGAAPLLRQAERVLRQRTEALRATKLDLVTLDVLDERLAAASVEIATRRAQALEELRPYTIDVASTMLGDDVLELRYERSWEGDVLEALRAARDDDHRRGFTSVGFHRDDVVLLLNGAPLRTVGSQGQVRTVVVALVVALARAVWDRRGERPVLLLDDVIAELDRRRAEVAMELLEGLQVFVSHTDPFARAAITITIEQGRVSDARAVAS
jgi:DNA replication and repair protein RecF